MYKITHESYLHLAELLQEEISTLNYYSGVIEFTDDDAEYRFAASIIVYRDNKTKSGYASSPITNLIPVWWELRTSTIAGEQINDFDFKILKKIVNQCS